MKLKTFVGFKGKIAFAEIGGIKFVLFTANQKQLGALWQHLMERSAGPLHPAGIKNAILVEANTLPERGSVPLSRSFSASASASAVVPSVPAVPSVPSSDL